MDDGYTTDDVIAALAERGYATTKRTLADWVHKGLLPRRTARGRGQARGKVYLWPEQDIVQRAATVHDLPRDYGRAARIPLALWLLGYDMPLEIVRQRLLAMLASAHQSLVAGEHTSDDIADHLSALAVQLAEQAARRRKATAPADLIEMGLNALANQRYRPSAVVVNELTDWLATRGASLAERQQDRRTRQGAKRLARWLVKMLRHLNLQELHDAVHEASDDELRRAHAWWCAVLHRARAFVQLMPADPLLAPLGRSAILTTGQLAIPLYLHLHRKGYGAQVDDLLRRGLVWADHTLASGTVQEAFAAARRENELVGAGLGDSL
jgi:hypothetical protein